MLSYMESVCDRMRASSPGAQTERRGDAGPVRDLLGGEAALAVFLLRTRSDVFSTSLNEFFFSSGRNWGERIALQVPRPSR